jgi:hypothetical protein
VVTSIFKNKNIKYFILGFITYFVISIILDLSGIDTMLLNLFGVDTIFIKGIVIAIMLVIFYFVVTIFKKK